MGTPQPVVEDHLPKIDKYRAETTSIPQVQFSVGMSPFKGYYQFSTPLWPCPSTAQVFMQDKREAHLHRHQKKDARLPLLFRLDNDMAFKRISHRSL